MRGVRLDLLCRFVGLIASLCLTTPAPHAATLADHFSLEVDMRLEIPAEQQSVYADVVRKIFEQNRLDAAPDQYVVAVDRNPAVQALLIFWWPAQGPPKLIGASSVSTGVSGTFDHFLTPLGLFEHSLDNMDFRAEGTKNEFGIRGYGRKGMRVFDFGWVLAERGWDRKGFSPMRLQMHATDPGSLEVQLGRARSKGCIRIPATLNEFLDRHGVLDADYDAAEKLGNRHWVLRSDRTPSSGAGRYLIVFESPFKTRPAWAPLPARREKPGTPRSPISPST